MHARILCLLLVVVSACSPAQRATVGATIGGLGAATSYAGLVSMVPSCRQRAESQQTCLEYSKPASRSVSVSLVFGGLGAIVLGGMVLATAERRASSPAREAVFEAPPSEPTQLDKREALKMAVAQLLVHGVDGEATSNKLLGVDDTQSRLLVQARRAELSNVRVRTASDRAWHTINACYELESEWPVTSLSKASRCLR